MSFRSKLKTHKNTPPPVEGRAHLVAPLFAMSSMIDNRYRTSLVSFGHGLTAFRAAAQFLYPPEIRSV